jgi:hypothetical protein
MSQHARVADGIGDFVEMLLAMHFPTASRIRGRGGVRWLRYR